MGRSVGPIHGCGEDVTAIFVPEEAMFGELTNVWRLFEPDRSVQRAEIPPIGADLGFAVFPGEYDGTAPAEARMYCGGRCVASVVDDTRFLELRTGAARERRQRTHQAKRALYRILSDYFGRTSPWGALTGIRPTKLYRELTDAHGENAARLEFTERYLVSEDRAALASSIMKTQRPFLKPGTVVYCGIPFCPTRCRYCSFISQDLSSAAKARSGYLDALQNELECGAELAGSSRVLSIYVGGGTPTVLETGELDNLLKTLARLFPGARELTVEAGRPDTISEEKLKIMERNGVTRLCINPQTTSDATLQLIGRTHTAGDFFRAMSLARNRFDSVNTDVIVGLPGEGVDSIRQTLDDVLEYAPENITVHALALKNAADFAKDRYTMLPSPRDAAAMSAAAEQILRSAGYLPYYLYRQKYMSGNLENIGWALPGHESIYNIGNMEETANVLAFGAGAISKRISCDGTRIDRASNVKDPLQYVERTEQMVLRKKALFLEE